MNIYEFLHERLLTQDDIVTSSYDKCILCCFIYCFLPFIELSENNSNRETLSISSSSSEFSGSASSSTPPLLKNRETTWQRNVEFSEMLNSDVIFTNISNSSAYQSCPTKYNEYPENFFILHQ